MGIRKDISSTLNSEQRGDLNKGAAYVEVLARGTGFSIAKTTGVIAAALAVNSTVFAMRLDQASPVRAYIDRIRLQYVTTVAYTTPVTAGRRLALYRGSGASASGGTAIATAAKKHSASVASEFDVAQGGDMRIATTGTLTTTGITFETDEIAQASLVHVGAVGGAYECVWEFSAFESSEVVLEPGQLLAIRNPQAMDASGTWQLAVGVQWREAELLG